MSEVNLQGESEESIVAALRQGRQQVLGKLYDSYAPIMMGTITRIVQDQEIAEEVLKETFVAIWTRIGIYDASKHRLLTWGLAIARGLALEAIKSDRYASISRTAIKTADTTTEKYKFVTLHKGDTKEANLCNLSSLEKAALELIYLKGRSCTETAAEMNMTEKQLKDVLKKAFSNLKAGKSI